MTRQRKPAPPGPAATTAETAAWVVREQERARDRRHDGRSTGYERDRVEQQEQLAAELGERIVPISALVAAGGWENTDTEVSCADDLIEMIGSVPEIADDERTEPS